MAARDRVSADAALVAALLAGASVPEAAKAAKISERTAYRRLRDDSVRRELAEARSALIGQAVGALARLSAPGTETLSKLLKAQSESVRLGAAKAVIDLAVRLRESEELEQRIIDLEARLGGDQPPTGGPWRRAS